MKPTQMALTAVMCGLPVVLVVFMLFTGALANAKMLLLSLALLALAAANLLLRTRFHGRAAKELEKMMQNGRIHKRFFDQQTLTLNDQGLSLAYPGFSIRYAWADYAGVVERRETFLLYFGAEPVAIVPRAAFADEAAQKAFFDAIYMHMRAAMIADSREQREDIPEKPFAVLRYEYDLAGYLRHQRAARRASVLQVKLWKRMDSMKVIAIIFLLAGVFMAVRPAVRAISALMLLGLLMPYVFVFSPLVDLSVRRSLDQVLRYRPGHGATLYAWEDGIKIVGDIHCLDITWSQIRAAAEIPEGVALYLTSGLPLTVPVREDIKDSIRFKLFVMQKYAAGKSTGKIA